MLDTRTKTYIETYKDDLKREDLDSFYSHIKAKTLTPILTDTLIKAGIDPIDYLTKIPMEYGSGMPRFKKLIIPSKVRTIDEGSFRHCPDLVEVELPNGIISIKSEAF